MTLILPSWGGKKILVAGLGVSGCAAIDTLLRSGANLLLWDDNPQKLAEIAKHYGLQQLDIHHLARWRTIDAMLPAPGIKPNHVLFSRANHANCQILSDIDLLQQATSKRQCRFIGITGTNGKSTVTAMIAHILQQAGRQAVAGGNIGEAALSLPLLDNGGYYVLELSSYQLHHLRHTRFHTAILLNIGMDHLDYHGSMQDYINAKIKIFAWQQPDDLAVVGISTQGGHSIAGTLHDMKQQKLQLFSGLIRVANGIYFENNCLWRVTEMIADDGTEQAGTPEIIFDCQQQEMLFGRHHAENLAAVWLVCQAEGLRDEQILQGIHSFTGLRHRQEYLGNIGNLHFINDSKATNIDATQMALISYANIFWLAGGELKDEPHRNLLDYAGQVKAAFFYGKDADKLYDIFSPTIASQKFENLQQAYQQAYQMAKDEAEADSDKEKHMTILLAPAAASFDQFDNFMHRGEIFRQYVVQSQSADNISNSETA